MAKKFAVADAEYTTFRNDVATSVAEMEIALDHETHQQQSAFADQGTDHLAHEANEMQASNRRYEEIVLRVKALRLRIKMLRTVEGSSPEAIEAELLFMHNEISRGLTYANEVYATQGAVLHTVYGKQGAAKKLEALQNEPDQGKKDAATELIGQDAAENISDYDDLYEIGADSVKEKAGAAGKDPEAVHRQDSAFWFTNANDLAEVKAATIKLGATVAAIYKKEKAQAEQGAGPG